MLPFPHPHMLSLDHKLSRALRRPGITSADPPGTQAIPVPLSQREKLESLTGYGTNGVKVITGILWDKGNHSET